MLLDEALAGVAGGDVDDFLVRGRDLLPAVLGVRARARRDARRPVDPSRRGDRAAAKPSRRDRVLPHALRRRAHRCRAVARSRRDTDRGRAPVEPRATVGLARRRAHPLGRPPGAGKGASRRPSSSSTASTSTRTPTRPARWQPSISRGARPRSPATCSSARSTQTDTTSSAAAPLLTLLVDVHSRRRARSRTRDAPRDLLSACATAHRSDYLGAVAALARGSGLPRDRDRRPAGLPPRGARRLRARTDADGARSLPARARRARLPPIARRSRSRRPGPRSMRSSSCRRRGTPTPPAALLRSLGAKPASTRPGATRS